MDCNRAQAVNKDSSNTSIWTNNVSSGIRLDPGDTVSVHSAFINEIGSGADTIEFLGNYLTTTSLSYTTGMYAPPSDNPSVVKDNAVGIVVSYYKNADADNALILPRLYCWSSQGATTDDGLPASPDKFATYDPDFQTLYRRKHDSRRYTIYQTAGQLTEHDIATNTWQMYRQRLDLAIDTGYNTPADISSRLTETLHASSEPEKLYDGPNFPYSSMCTSTVYSWFNCANSSTFSKANYDNKAQAYRDAYTYIGVLRPDLFEAGRALDRSKMKVKSYDDITHILTLDYEYNVANVALWQAVFDAQRHQFDQAALLLNAGVDRFIHVNTKVGTGWTQLGNDIDLTFMSVRQTINIVEGVGFIGNNDGFISFKLDALHTMFTGTPAFAGWDTHFSAFANDCIMLWSGVGPTNAGSYTANTTGTAAANAAGDSNVDLISSVYKSDNSVYHTKTKQLDELVESVYLGAVNPLISFDTSQSRFFLSGLHTPRKIRNDPQAGSHSTNPLNPDAGNDIYQVNPTYFKDTPSFSYNPEQRNLAANTVTADGAADTDIMKINLLEYFTVFDASSGICVEDWGVPAEHWDEGLWAKLGFTYDQLHTSGSRQARATNASVNMSPVSTNADVNSTQTMGWSVNIWGAPQQLSQLPLMGTEHWKETVKYKDAKPPYVTNRYVFKLGTITQPATSTRIIALNLPVKQTSSYWTIRSSLIDDARYFTSNGMMGVIAVVDKSYSGSDFYFMSDSNVRFTITKPQVLTAITSSVHLPDGRLARTDGNSCVIYEITKAPPLGNTSKA